MFMMYCLPVENKSWYASATGKKEKKSTSALQLKKAEKR